MVSSVLVFGWSNACPHCREPDIFNDKNIRLLAAYQMTKMLNQGLAASG